MMIRLERDPEISRKLHLGEVPDGTGLLFASNHSLVAPSFLHGNYLGPLLACLSPMVWCAHSPRPFDSIIFSLGVSVPGVSSVPVDSLDRLPRRTNSYVQARGLEARLFSRGSFREAIDWWVMRLDQLFTFLSDPATYRDESGVYDPYRHQNWLINTAELFERVTSALRAQRDDYAELVMTFSALDLIGDRFIGGDTGAKADPENARKALSHVRSSMPSSVAEVILPGAERAVAAVESIAGGFFIDDETVRYTTKKGVVECTREQAVGPLVGARRNAVHGFGGNLSRAKGAHELLSQHRGDLPSDIAYLPYLYLLQIMCSPEALRMRIERG